MKKIYVFCLAIALSVGACTTNSTNQNNDNLEIHDIQGCSHVSPFEGQKVNGIIGVVTHKAANGFTMQSITPDDLFCSSEGIFVFTKNYPSVMVADLVSVNGQVEEFTIGNEDDHNLTQTELIQTDYSVIQTEYALPEAIVFDDLFKNIPETTIENDEMSQFDPSEDGLDFYESLESMLVEIKSGIVVAPRNDYGEITVLPEPYINSNLISKQGPILITKDDANPEKVMVKLPTSDHDPVNAGDWVETPILGVLDYSYGNFKILAFSPLVITSIKQEENQFEAISDGLTIATYNLENLSPLDKNNKYSEISKQIVKILHSPNILVLNEVMDNSGSVDDGVTKADQTIKKLISAIQKAGGPDYSYSDTPPGNNQDGGMEGGNIRTVLLYREDMGIRLEENNAGVNGIKYKEGKYIVGSNPMLIGEFSSNFDGTRKPRIWLLNQNGLQFIVIGVHLTSQGASSPDWGNQQPPQKPEEIQRIEEARSINEQIKKDFLQNPNIPIFIAGDMNDLPWSGTIAALENEDFVSAVDHQSAAENYSYIFEGNAQELDYIFINKNLASNVLQARFVHVNSYLDLSEAVSDHDPMVIEYRLDQSAP
jgi:uncharacterized protein